MTTTKQGDPRDERFTVKPRNVRMSMIEPPAGPMRSNKRRHFGRQELTGNLLLLAVAVAFGIMMLRVMNIL